jgi:hypothetical protein
MLDRSQRMCCVTLRNYLGVKLVPDVMNPATKADRQTSALVQTTYRLSSERRHCTDDEISHLRGRDAPADRSQETQTKYVLAKSAQRLKANQKLREEHHEHQDRRQNPLPRYQ